MATQFTNNDILSQLDAFANRGGMWFLDDGQSYTVDCRLTAYRDDDYWAVTLEHVIYSPGAGTPPRGGHKGIITAVECYGSALRVKPGGFNFVTYNHTRNAPGPPTFLFENVFRRGDPSAPLHPDAWEHVNPAAKAMMIRGRIVPIETDPAVYEAMGMKLVDPPRVKAHELLRGLPLPYRKLLLATEEERMNKKFLKRCRPPKLLQLDEWYYPPLSLGELPSQNETFQMVADVLVTGDLSKYQPTKLPNTHWSHWPKAGMFERPAP